MVALQMPEGLQMFACTIADIIERYADGTLFTAMQGELPLTSSIDPDLRLP